MKLYLLQLQKSNEKQSMNKLHKIFLFTTFLFVLFACDNAVTDMPEDKTVYFLVAETNPNHNDSYILPLTKPEDIKHAREIIGGTGTTSNKIVVAKIAKGNGAYVNKDLIGGKTWSWYVSDFIGFADNTIEILDGYPTYVEENLDEWIRITSGKIGFWTYTVTREVNLSDIK
ncbi:MAG: hypothetical protein M1495_06755 [Bacteroidetes bacterium]|nr:hypothetical protein [Bacteroidota bacterium]